MKIILLSRHASEGWHPCGGCARRRFSMGPSIRWGDEVVQ
jgi:hypothetical protein